MLSGCAQNAALIPADDFAKKVAVNTSDFDTDLKYVAPKLYGFKKRGLLSAGDRMKLNLRGWKDKATGKVRHQLYIVIEYDNDWRHYQSASFLGGSNQDLTVIDREVTGCHSYSSLGVFCDYRETLGLSFSDTDLNAAKEEGLKIRINAKSGHENILELPANYIKGYLQATL